MIDSSFRKRLVISAVFLTLLYCLLIVRFYCIQILQGDHWKQVALNQHQYVEDLPFKRGSFYSNTSIKQGHPEEPQAFVIDVQKFHLFIDPDSVPSISKQKMAAALSKMLNQPASLIREDLDRKSRSRKIASFLDLKKKEEIAFWWSSFCKQEKIVRNAIYFNSDSQRSYPFGSMLGTVLHTVREDRDALGQSIPTGGLEMLYHSYLSGKAGKRLIVRSPSHPLDTGKVLQPSENGADIYLTVNHYLQAIAEAELTKGIQTAGALGGWAVMMDPYNGEILALAQTPSFNPAKYKDYYNSPADLEYTKVKAVTDCFEPGSIFKAVTVAVCLKASEELVAKGKPPILTPDEWVPTANGWFPGRGTPLKDARVHKQLNLNLGLQKSSNIYMGRIIQRVIETMGDQWYRNELVNTFGLGQKTHIELPAESIGLVPTPGRLHPNGKLEWSVPTPYSLSMGHNILVNSIQMVRSYAIFANGGFLVEPHIIRKISKKQADGSTKILVDNSKMKAPKKVLSPAIASRIVEALKYVTKEGGTSKLADIHGYTEAGKSGTAEKIIDGVYSKTHNISSFLGFAPANNPRFILLVSVDDPVSKMIPGVGRQQFGGICAAPIFREISSRALQYLGVEPDDPYGYPVGDPRRNPAKADMISKMQTLKDEYQRHNQ
jgi:cell division protein FtsI (penicillin-binding protein 3)